MMDDTQLKQLINSKREIRIGDKVRLLKGGNRGSMHGFQNGDTYMVVYVDVRGYISQRITLVNEHDHEGYCDPDQLEVVT